MGLDVWNGFRDSGLHSIDVFPWHSGCFCWYTQLSLVTTTKFFAQSVMGFEPYIDRVVQSGDWVGQHRLKDPGVSHCSSFQFNDNLVTPSIQLPSPYKYRLVTFLNVRTEQLSMSSLSARSFSRQLCHHNNTQTCANCQRIFIGFEFLSISVYTLWNEDNMTTVIRF